MAITITLTPHSPPYAEDDTLYVSETASIYDYKMSAHSDDGTLNNIWWHPDGDPGGDFKLIGTDIGLGLIESSQLHVANDAEVTLRLSASGYNNKTQHIKIVAEELLGANPGTPGLRDDVEFDIKGLFPSHPDWKFEMDLISNVRVSAAADGTLARVLRGRPKRLWSLALSNRLGEDWRILEDFYRWHDRLIEFYFHDRAHTVLDTNEASETFGEEIPSSTLVIMDSDLKSTPQGECHHSFNIALREI